MKKLLNYLLLFPFIINAQIATIDIIQVKDGMEDDYEAVEAFVAPIQKEAIKQGRKFAWYILKRVSGGDLSEIEDDSSDDEENDEEPEFPGEDAVEDFEHCLRPGEQLYIDEEHNVFNDEQTFIGTYDAESDTIDEA